MQDSDQARMKVVVIDDERLSSHNLGIQLRFVGEAPVMSTSENWQQVLSRHTGPGDVLVMIIGAIKHTGLDSLVQAVLDACPDASVLLPGRQQDPAIQQLSPAARERLQLLDEADLNYQALSAVLARARQEHGLAGPELASRLLSPTGSTLFRSLTGNSPAIVAIRRQIQQVASRQVSVLVSGASGTGKEVVARNLHYHSGRGDAPFIAVNCAAIDAGRYGVELFGQAATAGNADSRGLLEQANGGTLYFDEVSALPLNIQSLLLRFLEDLTFHRVGSGQLLRADVRIVAATSTQLEDRIRRGSFRQDLYYRLCMMPIELPPLRQRLQDIPDLVKELLGSLKSKGYRPVSLNTAAIDALQQHTWPGNVRELANLVERLCIMHDEGIIGVGDLPLEYRVSDDRSALLEEIEALDAGAEQAGPASAPAVQGRDEHATQTGGAETPAASPAAAPQADGEAGQDGDAGAPAPDSQPGAQASTPAPDDTQDKPEGKGGADGKVVTAAAEPSPGLMPLNDMLLQHYLYNFEKQLLITALDDCANILGFAAERLAIDEGELTTLMDTYKLESF